MRLARALGDVTIGTLIVIVHAAIAERLPRRAVDAYSRPGRRPDPRRVSWPRPAVDRRASGRPQ